MQKGHSDKPKSSLLIQIGPQGFRVLTNGCPVTAASHRTGITLKTKHTEEDEAVFSANTKQFNVCVINKVRIEWTKLGCPWGC